MSNQEKSKCQHGWHGEGYNLRSGDSAGVVHHKNNYNAAVGRAFGGVPDQPTASSFAAQSFMNAHVFKTAPGKIEAGCNCTGKTGSDSGEVAKAGPVTNFLAGQTGNIVNRAAEATRKSVGKR